MVSRGVAVRHNFETAHRLPHIGGKCVNLHGHSWLCEVLIEAEDVDADGLVVEFGGLKRALREWIDTNWDHGTMLGAADPLCAPLTAAGCKLYLFEGWPTVEAVAEELAAVAAGILAGLASAPGAAVARVSVQETAVNTATWRLL